jgi:hypothetical protein
VLIIENHLTKDMADFVEQSMLELPWYFQTWEKGEEMPGKTLANLKTAGLDEVLKQLIATGWKPTA